MKQVLTRIASLQRQYSSQNTPAMQERGRLIRRELPESLSHYWERFQNAIPKYANDIAIDSSDGIGRKTQAPWVRIHSRSLSPSATTGFYVVIHFSSDGTRCFVTLGCGATRWDSVAGDLKPYDDDEILRKTSWARKTLEEEHFDVSDFSKSIDLGSTAALPKRFEKATILGKEFKIDSLTEDGVVDSIEKALSFLSSIYDHHTELRDFSQSEVIVEEISRLSKPSGRRGRQGFGLSGPERLAVELRGMSVAREYLISEGYAVKDTSKTQSFDLLARRPKEQIKVEVKATTSADVDAVPMTRNEVDLHRDQTGVTALAIVSDVRFVSRGDNARCSGGELEFIYPWDLDEWEIEPIAFRASRP